MVFNFTCPSRICPASKLLRTAYFHTVVGMEHIHGYQLMVYRVCEAFQKCIPRENIKVHAGNYLFVLYVIERDAQDEVSPHIL